jgi:hypothetical protein
MESLCLCRQDQISQLLPALNRRVEHMSWRDAPLIPVTARELADRPSDKLRLTKRPGLAVQACPFGRCRRVSDQAM